jgi:hypothetical protein
MGSSISALGTMCPVGSRREQGRPLYMGTFYIMQSKCSLRHDEGRRVVLGGGGPHDDTRSLALRQDEIDAAIQTKSASNAR